MTRKEEEAYQRGIEAASARIVQLAAQEMAKGQARDEANAIVELHAARVALRGLFERLKVPGWHEQLWLPDLIEKRLERHLADEDE